MKDKKQFFTGILTGLFMAVLVICVTYGAQAFLFMGAHGSLREETSPATSGLSSDTLTKLKFIEELIKENYALSMVSDEELEKGVYEGLVDALGDPYSKYYSQEEMSKQQEKLEGVYYGIGSSVSLDEETGYAKLVEVYEDSPAQKAGLLEGDLIKEVDSVSVKGMSLDEIIAMVRGDKDTTVKFLVVRNSEEGQKEFDVNVKRGSVPRITVDSQMLENDIGLIYISEFDSVTVDQFADALATLKGQGMKGLVIDLRGNPGGNFSAAVDIARRILPEGIITYTLAKNGERNDYNCDGKNELKVPLAVLVDNKTASSSEIVSGAIKDYKKGVLVGTTTYGKGIVQKYIGIADGSAVKLTTSKYYTPRGYNIHGIGIAPDIEVEFDPAAYEKGVDNQLEEAIKYLMKNK